MQAPNTTKLNKGKAPSRMSSLDSSRLGYYWLMWQQGFNCAWIVLFIVTATVRKIHQRRAHQPTTLRGIHPAEAVLMLAWGASAGVIPFFYIFSSWLEFADLPARVQPVSGAIGVATFLFAIWLLHRSHTDLGDSWSLTSETRSGQALVTNGIYRRIRHPMYSAHVLWGIAQFLLLPNLVAGPVALLLILMLLVWRIPREEQALLEKFGDEYREYMEMTGRILPRLRPRLTL